MDGSPVNMLQTHDDTLAGGGEMGALMRSLDWSQTPLGPVAGWPQSLRTAVSICLASHFPMLIWWGPELVMLYNDAYRPILGAIKHPNAMGQRGRECWPEIWDIIGPMLEGVLTKGEATWSENQMLPLERNGYVEECYFTFSYSPIRDETGGVGGVFTAVTETTRQVVGERRLNSLHDLAERVADAQTAEEVCLLAAATLADNADDIPFALFYLLENDGKLAHRVSNFGVSPNAAVASERVDLTQDFQDSIIWPFAQVVETGQSVIVIDLTEKCIIPPTFTYQPIPHSALLLPISHPGQQFPYGLLVVGISAMRVLDDDYRNFFRLVAGQVANAIAKARAYQEERQRAEALAELDRVKTAFFSNVSHEFRTPLTLMLGPIEDALADAEHALQVEQFARLEIVRRNCLRLLKLVNTLLDFSRIEAGRIQAAYEPTDLALFTTELASIFRSAIEQAQLHYIVDCPPLPEPVYVDRDMWEKIVLNLLSNAFKFTFDGSISVALGQSDTIVKLEVCDTGAGIPANELPDIFKRFHRVTGTHARTYEGSGIGLALVQELVYLHGGTVEVTSTVGEGTCFTVTLPLGSAHLPPEQIFATSKRRSTALGATPYIEEALRLLPSTSEEHGSSMAEVSPVGTPDAPIGVPLARNPSASILVVDDNADMRDYLRRMLSTHYSVQAATNGVEALQAIADTMPDLVLSDIMMPELDGFQLLNTLRSNPQTSTLPIILLSARAGEEAAVEGLQAGADDYLVKPFSARELLARVQTHLSLAQLRQEAAERERQYAHRLQKLAQASLSINAALSSEDILWLINDQARAIIGTHQAITTMAVNERLSRTISAISFSDKYAEWREYDIQTDGSALYAQVCSTNTSLRLTQAELEVHLPGDNSSSEVSKQPPMRGWLAAPLIGRDGGNLGVIQLSDKYEGEFTAEDEAILIQLAQFAAVAIENAHLYNQAQGAIRGRDELLSAVSHDLKNPLGTIKGYAQLLRRHVMRASTLNSEQLVDGLTRIDTTVGKMTALINDMLGITRQQMGQSIELDRQPADLIELARQVVAEQQQTTQQHVLHIQTDLQQLIGSWDVNHLERVLANLLSNAIKYSPDGGDILIEIRQQDDGFALLSVQDSGMGIPADDLPHIFEQFHRASNVSGKISGTGIGLASAYRIVELHGGRISVESKEGAGAKFTVLLPLSIPEGYEAVN